MTIRLLPLTSGQPIAFGEVAVLHPDCGTFTVKRILVEASFDWRITVHGDTVDVECLGADPAVFNAIAVVEGSFPVPTPEKALEFMRRVDKYPRRSKKARPEWRELPFATTSLTR